MKIHYQQVIRSVPEITQDIIEISPVSIRVFIMVKFKASVKIGVQPGCCLIFLFSHPLRELLLAGLEPAIDIPGCQDEFRVRIPLVQLLVEAWDGRVSEGIVILDFLQIDRVQISGPVPGDAKLVPSTVAQNLKCPGQAGRAGLGKADTKVFRGTPGHLLGYLCFDE